VWSNRTMRSNALTRTTAALALALALTACSSGEPEEGSGGSTATGGDDSLQQVLDSGTLTVGTEGTYRPFSFHEGGSGELTGFDVEVARAVGEQMGVEVEFEETQWDAIFAGLEAGRFDVIANQVTMTPEREEAYTFSTPYTVSTGVVVVPEDDTEITSFADLDGKRTAQSLTSNWKTLAEESGATVEGVEGWAQAAALVQQGRVDATINDKLTFLDAQQSGAAEGLKIAAETEETSQTALALPQGADTLKERIDEALAALAEDGTLVELSEKYFGADVTR
jgi:cystine transport system substrate-binding protein